MKTKEYYLKLLTIVSVIPFFYIHNLFAQGNNWKISGNDNVSMKDYIGTNNAADFNIKTNDTLRMKVAKEGNVEIFGKLKILPNTLTIDGINDRITTDDIYLNLGNEGFFDDIKVGIGTEQPFLFDATGNLRGLEVTGDINITNANC